PILRGCGGSDQQGSARCPEAPDLRGWRCFDEPNRVSFWCCLQLRERDVPTFWVMLSSCLQPPCSMRHAGISAENGNSSNTPRSRRSSLHRAARKRRDLRYMAPQQWNAETDDQGEGAPQHERW